MNTKNLLKNKLVWIIGGVVLLVIIIVIAGGNSTNNIYTPQKSNDGFFEKTKEVFQSPEKRLGCVDEKIENLNNNESAESKKIKITIIGTNVVEYPLNKKEVMKEYCIRVANLTSDMSDVKLLVQFLDKNNNVLAEEEDYAFDIPGRRAKTIYGSVFVETQLSKEIATIQVLYIK